MIKVKSQVHIRVPESNRLRRNLLETNLKTLELMRSFKRLKDIKIQKRKSTSHFKRLMQDVRKLVNDLELNDLPEYEVTPDEQRTIIKDVKFKTSSQNIELPRIRKDALESEIDDIKAQLDKLNF